MTSATRAGSTPTGSGSNLLNHNVFLSVGHDEYWSGAQRANIEAARDAGVNLQFLTGNEGYWRTRYEPAASSDATAYRTLVSYKETWATARSSIPAPSGRAPGVTRASPRNPPVLGYPRTRSPAPCTWSTTTTFR